MSNKKKKYEQDSESDQSGINSGNHRVKRQNRFWLIAATISIILNIVLIYFGYQQKENTADYDIMLSDYMVRLDDTEHRLQDCDAKATRFEKEVKVLKYGPLEEQKEKYVKPLDFLKDAGFTNPKLQLKSNIINNAKDLIPYKSAPNRNMRIVSRDAITILSPQLVYASFTDGEIKGYMLLQYKVAGTKKIDWTVIKAYKE